MTDYQKMLIVFNVTSEQEAEVGTIISDLMNQYTERIEICNRIKGSNLSKNERELAFYIWGCREGYSDCRNGR